MTPLTPSHIFSTFYKKTEPVDVDYVWATRIYSEPFRNACRYVRYQANKQARQVAKDIADKLRERIADRRYQNSAQICDRLKEHHRRLLIAEIVGWSTILTGVIAFVALIWWLAS